MKCFFKSFLILSTVFVLSNCTKNKEATTAEAGQLSGAVLADGSSTVFPVTEAVAEEFRAVQPKVHVSVGMSGTGGGFKKFCHGETDISDASRPIKEKEAALAETNGVRYVEYPVAFDGITVVVHKDNDWANDITVEELKKLWSNGSKIKTWAQIRKGWPDRPIKLFGPGTDSGTFDYFTEEVNGKAGDSRSDYTMSEDDNVLVKGIAGTKDSLGYFGYAYYKENQSLLKALPIDAGKGAIAPSEETINNGSYAPLSRPIFIYVSVASLETKPHVKSFVRFYLENAGKLSGEVGYVALPTEKYTAMLASEVLNLNAR